MNKKGLRCRLTGSCAFLELTELNLLLTLLIYIQRQALPAAAVQCCCSCALPPFAAVCTIASLSWHHLRIAAEA